MAKESGFKSAQKKGYEAAKAGKTKEDCPYEKVKNHHSFSYRWWKNWMIGWDTWQKEKTECSK